MTGGSNALGPITVSSANLIVVRFPASTVSTVWHSTYTYIRYIRTYGVHTLTKRHRVDWEHCRMLLMTVQYILYDV